VGDLTPLPFGLGSRRLRGLYKRLAKGRFQMPRVKKDADRIVLDGTELAMLLGGFEVGRAARIDAWEPKKQLKSDRGGLSGQNFR
jgi:hypothetical protein